MSAYVLWWIAAGTLVAIELLTGTFYLLMISTGVVLAGLAALLGAGFTAQLLVCAVVSTGATVGWHRWRKRHPAVPPAESNRDLHLDVGESLHIDQWSAEGTASVRYRGSQWQVVLAPGCPAVTGLQTIVRLEGNRLIVQPAA